MDYLNQENARIRQKVENNNEKHEQYLRVKYGQEEQERMLKEMTQKYENYEKRMKNRDKSPGDISMSTQRVGSLDEIKNPKDTSQAKSPKHAVVRKKSEQVINVKAAKRYNHPSSKLLIINPERQKDYLGLAANIVDPKISKRKNEDPKEYMLQIHSAPSLKNPHLFSRFYSGGPPEFDYEAPLVSFFYQIC